MVEWNYLIGQDGREAYIKERDRMTRILAVDMDETLLQNDSTVSDYTLEMAQAWEEAGNRLVIATGRPPRMIPMPLPPDFPEVPQIAYNGAEIRYQGNAIYHDLVTPDDTNQIVRLFQEAHPELCIRLEVDDVHLSMQPIPGRPREYYKEVERLDNIDQPCAKVLFITDDFDAIQPTLAQLPATTTALLSEKYNLVQIMSHTCDKVSALRYLVNQWGFTLDDAIAVGDDVNDVGMVRDCGRGFAVSNGVPEVKAVADEIVASNQEDGVAKLIQRLLNE